MGLKIIIDYPLWYILPFVLLAAAYSWLLYRKSKKDSFPIWVHYALGAARFIAVFLICLLLFTPLIRRDVNELEKPLIIFAHDNSMSLTAIPDSAFYRQDYLKQLEDVLRKIEKSYDLRFFTFGESLTQQSPDSLNYSEKLTDMSQVFSEAQLRYANRNIGAIVLAGDGIFNRGANPLYQTQAYSRPVFTIALGDTNRYKDLLINNVKHNRIAYLGNKFPVEVQLSGRSAEGSTARLEIIKGNSVVHRQETRITSNDFFVSIPFFLEASSVGVQKFSARIIPVEGELSLENNTMDFYVEVIDSRQKILLLAHAPHPDLGALRMSLQSNDNYEVEMALVNDFKGRLRDYNLLILHQLPSERYNISALLSEAGSLQLPVWFIAGSQTQFNLLSAALPGMNFTRRSNALNESFPVIRQDFSLFSISPNTAVGLQNFPPLYTPFGLWQVSANVNTLMYQRIGAVSTQQPLMCFLDNNGQKIALLAGEGLWRWRMTDFSRNRNHQIFQDWLFKTVQYLSVKEEKKPFIVKTKNQYEENEAVSFEAQVYNPSFELINEPEVNLVIRDESQKVFTYTFSRTPNAYTLNAGNFMPGLYSWEASVNTGNKIETAQGQFSVSELNLEGINTIADHRLLFQMANNTGGQMLYPQQMQELPDLLKAREDIRPIIYSHKKYDELISLPWLFFLIITLLGLEWFTRKYFGSY